MLKKYLHMGFTRSRNIGIIHQVRNGKRWWWKVLPYDRKEQRFMDSSLIFQKYWKLRGYRVLKLKEEFKNGIEMES